VYKIVFWGKYYLLNLSTWEVLEFPNAFDAVCTAIDRGLKYFFLEDETGHRELFNLRKKEHEKEKEK
jgi:hypothetical protein